MAPPDPPQLFRFLDFDLDVAGYQLRRNGRPVRLERQPMDLLILLVANRQRLVTRAEIVDSLWGKDVFVDVETGVHTAVRKIRQALHDSPDAPRFVETVSRQGLSLCRASRGGARPARLFSGTRTAHGDLANRCERVAAGRGDGVGGSSHAGTRSHRGRVVAGVIVVALVAGLATWGWWRGATRAESPVTIAVLPFENLSGDPDREYLADGLAEETIVSLGQIDPERVHVVGRTSMMVYKRTTKSLATIGRELGADYLVESSVRVEGDRLRITARLVRADDQVQMWSRAYDREPGSMLGLQQELSTAIAEQVRLRLSPERLDALSRRQTRNPEAYDLYLRGRNFANQRTPPTTARAIEYFQRATTLDPNYALAWSGLAFAYLASPINGDANPLEVQSRTVAAVAQAIRADAILPTPSSPGPDVLVLRMGLAVR